ncbi:MAG: SPASM domain-containing protein [Clostridia bacterium]|nr:SPASM domain-containing protein [Clostridia bacterium]
MYLLIKPASGSCNLRCSYCFYADEMVNRECRVRGIMKQETFDEIIRKAAEYIASPGCPDKSRTLSVGFQGGEPLLAGKDFFRHAVSFIGENVPRNISVSLFVQTNGTLIDEEWAAFLAKNGFLTGISLDGIPETHDKNRRTADGKGTYSAVIKACGLLKDAGAEFNILTVITGETARSARKIYTRFAGQGFTWQQYIPCIAPLGGADTRWTLSAERYGTFLCTVFDLWYADVTRGKQVSNREFENWIGILAGVEPEDCGMRGICSAQYLIESDGSVYPCDFYALDDCLLGNLTKDGFESIDEARKRLRFIEQSAELPEKCKSCSWLPLCRNGCRRNRGDDGVNRFCEAYRKLFPYAYPRMRQLAEALLRNGSVRR